MQFKLTLPAASESRLKALQEFMGGSVTEVLKAALRAFEWLVKQEEEGKTLYQKNEAGEFVPVSIFYGTPPQPR